eukprot:s26_g52.t1
MKSGNPATESLVGQTAIKVMVNAADGCDALVGSLLGNKPPPKTQPIFSSFDWQVEDLLVRPVSPAYMYCIQYTPSFSSHAASTAL